MRIALVSDIHGNLPALEAVVEDIGRRGVDAVVNLGDSLSGPLLPRETAQFLMARDWLHLAGNHERQLLTLPPREHGASDAFAYSQLTSTELAWLASLPPHASFRDDVFLCHGTPESDSEYFLETVEPSHVRPATPAEALRRLGSVGAALIASGHSHVPRSVRLPNGQLIVNPGSVGLQAYDDVLPYPHVIATGSPDARYAIVERNASTWVSALISVPYAHEAMAALALSRQRPDWASALATGYLSV
ncbi:MAG: metallophosphoesterase family protein [Acidobacteria bacterium]|nr:metallophosphoesterase family protein [Acidobacteriota bacterium]